MFDKLSIRHKLVVLLGASSALALLISAAVALYSTFVGETEASLRVLRQVADITSENMRAALAFRDARSAANMLAPLKTNPHILYAHVADDNGDILGEYRGETTTEDAAERHRRMLRTAARAEAGRLNSETDAHLRMERDHHFVIHPIHFEGKPIGMLAIVSDNEAMLAKMRRFVLMQGVASLLILASLVVLSLRLQTLFTCPIFQLIAAMRAVAATKDYTTALDTRRKDEFNDLYLGFNAMLDEIRARDDRLSTLATTDALTGLANRRHAFDELQQMAARAQRKNEPLGVIMLDVDFFKRINDSRGHSTGDGVLRDIARIALASAREYDLVARIGGEEFLVLCDGGDLAATAAVAERIRAGVAAHAFAPDDEPALRATVSLGIYSAVPTAHAAERLVEIADQALYRAKQAGRNRVEIGKIGE